MKKELHPTQYQPIVFRDINSNVQVLTRSTLAGARHSQTVEWEDGNTYPVVEVNISAYSHPFYTGKRVTAEEVGSIARFHAKYGKKK